MRAADLSVIAAALAVLVGHSAVSGQGLPGLGQVSRPEAVALREVVDGVIAGQPPGGDAWLKWSGHFMRAPDGRVYIPFTVTLAEVETGFESVAMYVRVLPRGSKPQAGAARVSGSQMATPVSAPESQFSRGNPTAGEASARLGLMASELGAVKAPFEGFFVAKNLTNRPSSVVRRSLVVAPGEYDLYVAVRERVSPRSRSQPKWAVLQQALTVPDLGGGEPTTSSIILAERVDALDKRLSPAQQMERPYAFSSAEVVPDADAAFTQDDVLSVVFFVYNLNVDQGNLPDVTVEYRFRQVSLFGKVFGEMAPQRFSHAHTPPAFDAKAGRQLAVTQALPLAAFPPDNYELEIAITDNLSGVGIQRVVRFSVGG